MVKKFVFWDSDTFELGVAEDPKARFWSSIIDQTAGSISVSANSGQLVTIQPATDETWWIWIDFVMLGRGSAQKVEYYDYDGSAMNLHIREYRSATYTRKESWLSVAKILTDTLYGRLYFENNDDTARDAYYGYSGFKLSERHWSPKRLSVSPMRFKPWKRKPREKLPERLKGLKDYAWEVLGYGENPWEYTLVIMLEEEVPLAVDPETGFPVERSTAFIPAKKLEEFLVKFERGEADPVKTGLDKYIKKWDKESLL